MPKPKGYVPPKAERLRASRTHAMRNAVTSAGAAVLAAALDGDSEKVAAIAAEKLTEVREQFGDEMFFRILPTDPGQD